MTNFSVANFISEQKWKVFIKTIFEYQLPIANYSGCFVGEYLIDESIDIMKGHWKMFTKTLKNFEELLLIDGSYDSPANV